MFPEHKCGLYLTHNEHRDYYERLEQYLTSRDDFFDDCFESPEARQRALDTDEMWHLQWYPDTPMGFYHVAAPTLEDVLRLANAVAKSVADETAGAGPEGNSRA